MLTNPLLKTTMAPLVIFMIFLISLFTNIYQIIPSFDMILHFAGGASIALCALAALRILQINSQIGKINLFFKFLFVVSIVALTAVLWEFAEFINDIFFPWKLSGSLNDTLLDLALGIIGGAMTALFKRN